MWRPLKVSAFMALGLALLPGAAVSQQKTLSEQLIGTWKIVSVRNTRPDGNVIRCSWKCCDRSNAFGSSEVCRQQS
jgi:hypothetical protein